MKKRTVGIVVMALALAGCHHTAPQNPSQRKGSEPTVDSAQLALMELNQHLAATADMQLAQIVQEQPERYALYEGSAWIAILDRGDENSETPKQNEEWTVHMRTYDLDGHMLMDSEATYRIGKRELPQAAETAIAELYRGGKAKVIAPWYAAYGMQGNDFVAPYQNVIIELELK